MVLGGMRGTAVRENFGSAQCSHASGSAQKVRWLDTDEARDQAQAEVDALLQKPLTGR